MFLARRSYTRPKNDAFSLANALGLLSLKNGRPAYKPSLLQHLQKGSVAEQFRDLEGGLEAEYPVPSVNHTQLFDSLVVDLNTVNATFHRNRQPGGPAPKEHSSQKSLISHIKSIDNEDELLELLRLSYYQNTLSLQLLTQFMMNRNFKDLSRLPFDVKNLQVAQFSSNGWTSRNITEFKVLLLKKYHDLKSPLTIVKLLKDNFESEFFPLIRAQKLVPFYERIVWKFYFDFLDQAQQKKMVDTLHSMRHSFLIWEASADSSLMREVIAEAHEFNSLQKLFVQLASWNSDNPKFLSSLKAISAKFKLYNMKTGDNVETRAYAYSLFHRLDACVKQHFPDWKNDAFLSDFMESLVQARATMMQQEVHEAKAGSLVHEIYV